MFGAAAARGPVRRVGIVRLQRVRGWEAFAEIWCDRSLCQQVFALLEHPGAAVAALRSRPCTLIHGDLDIANHGDLRRAS